MLFLLKTLISLVIQAQKGESNEQGNDGKSVEEMWKEKKERKGKKKKRNEHTFQQELSTKRWKNQTFQFFNSFTISSMSYWRECLRSMAFSTFLMELMTVAWSRSK